MIISIAISFKSTAIWTCAEDFETAEEGFLYAQERALKRFGAIQSIAVAPLRATGLIMAEEIRQKLSDVRIRQVLRGIGQ